MKKKRSIKERIIRNFKKSALISFCIFGGIFTGIFLAYFHAFIDIKVSDLILKCALSFAGGLIFLLSCYCILDV